MPVTVLHGGMGGEIPWAAGDLPCVADSDSARHLFKTQPLIGLVVLAAEGDFDGLIFVIHEKMPPGDHAGRQIKLTMLDGWVSPGQSIGVRSLLSVRG
jgi:hypothetical protein